LSSSSSSSSSSGTKLSKWQHKILDVAVQFVDTTHFQVEKTPADAETSSPPTPPQPGSPQLIIPVEFPPIPTPDVHLKTYGIRTARNAPYRSKENRTRIIAEDDSDDSDDGKQDEAQNSDLLNKIVHEDSSADAQTDDKQEKRNGGDKKRKREEPEQGGRKKRKIMKLSQMISEGRLPGNAPWLCSVKSQTNIQALIQQDGTISYNDIVYKNPSKFVNDVLKTSGTRSGFFYVMVQEKSLKNWQQ